MPDDHESTVLTYTTDDDYDFHDIVDISDINIGHSMEEDLRTILGRKDLPF